MGNHPIVTTVCDWELTVQGQAHQDLDAAVEMFENQVNNFVNNDRRYTGSVNKISLNNPADPPFRTDYSEKEFIEACVEDLADSGVILDGDNIIITDVNDDPNENNFGYGQAHRVDYQGDTYHACRVLHTPSSIFASDPLDTFKNLAMHELSHTFNAVHEDGSFSKGNSVIEDVSPMATSYVRTIQGEPDTCFGGGNTPPTSFDCAFDNYPGLSYCGSSCTDNCLHDGELTYCTLDRVGEWVDG